MKSKILLLLKTAIAVSLAPCATLIAQVPQTIHYQGKVTVDGEPFDGTGYFKFAIIDGGTENVSTALATATINLQNGWVDGYEVVNKGSGYLSPPEVTISGGGGSGAEAEAVLINGEVDAVIPVSSGSGYTSLPKVAIASPPPASMLTYWSNDGSSSGGSEPGDGVALIVSEGIFSVNLGHVELDGMTEPITAEILTEGPLYLRVWFDDGSGTFEQLSPDQPLASVPYALTAEVADFATSVAEGAVSFDQVDPGIALWTQDESTGAFAYFVQNQGIRITPFTDQDDEGFVEEWWSPMIVIGHSNNVASARGATVLGGGTESSPNIASGDFSTVGGGWNNTASGSRSIVGGGQDNEASGNRATVGGGQGNEAREMYSSVGGGLDNSARDWYSTIGGGRDNISSGTGSTVGGGQGNFASFIWSTVAGGFNNRAFGHESSVGGGNFNTASGFGSTIPGGRSNEAAGDYSFAAGRRAKVGEDHHGTFVWADHTNANFESTGEDQFLIRAGGGVGINTNDPDGFEVYVHENQGIRVTPFTDEEDIGIDEEFWSPMIVMGHGNNVASARGATVSGGGSGPSPNIAGGGLSTVGGGSGNEASGFLSTVGGGQLNSASAVHSTVGGGQLNLASGLDSTVPGGRGNRAGGDYSFAVGRSAWVGEDHHGTFVWSDSGYLSFNSTGEDQFLIQASGGVGIGTNAPSNQLSVDGRADFSERVGIGTSSPWTSFHVISDENDDPLRVAVGSNSGTALRVYGHRGLAIGSSWIESSVPERGLRVHGDAMKPGGGSWSSASDERLKHNINPIPSGILDQLLELTGYTFEFKEEAIAKDLALPGEQIGLIAQEVAEVFPDWVGEDNDGYLFVTERGVTAIFVEALRELRDEKSDAIEEQQAIINVQETRIAELENQLAQQADLEARLTRLEAMLAGEELAVSSD